MQGTTALTPARTLVISSTRYPARGRWAAASEASATAERARALREKGRGVPADRYPRPARARVRANMMEVAGGRRPNCNYVEWTTSGGVRFEQGSLVAGQDSFRCCYCGKRQPSVVPACGAPWVGPRLAVCCAPGTCIDWSNYKTSIQLTRWVDIINDIILEDDNCTSKCRPGQEPTG